MPPLLLYVYLVIFPVIQAVYYSFYKWNGLGPPINFIGLGNYVALVQEPVFRGAFLHNWIIAFLSVAVQLPLALGLALLVGRGLRGRGIFRVILFLPFILSEVITGVIWTFIYRADGGLVNLTIQSLVSGFPNVSWLGNPDTVLYAIFITLTWKYFGLYLILFVAGLQNIPHELEEGLRGLMVRVRFRSFAILSCPCWAVTVRLTIYLSVVGSLQVFDLVWIMTTGGPVNASNTMAVYFLQIWLSTLSIGLWQRRCRDHFLGCLWVLHSLSTLCHAPRRGRVIASTVR